MKNAFYFMLKTLFVLETYTFSSTGFGYVEKRLYRKTEINFRICDVTNWTKINYNTHIVQYLKK